MHYPTAVNGVSGPVAPEIPMILITPPASGKLAARTPTCEDNAAPLSQKEPLDLVALDESLLDHSISWSRGIPNFGIVVEDNIYRSRFPQMEHYKFLVDNLKPKTILTLAPIHQPSDYLELLSCKGIVHKHIELPANKSKINITQELIERVLSVVSDPSNHPILIHCNKGKHRTGCVVGCLRKVLGASTESILNEYRAYAGTKARPFDIAFLEAFDTTNARRILDMMPGDRLQMAESHYWVPIVPSKIKSSFLSP
jgi:hypothetical protein